jgi:cytidine deaminase
MNDVRSTLIATAKAVCGAFSWGKNDASACAVGAAILTAQGNIYTGICIDLACGLGFCAETAAVAEMLKARETHILAVAAVHERDGMVAPCGRCRETIAQVDARNFACTVFLEADRTVSLRELLPEYWLAKREDTA